MTGDCKLPNVARRCPCVAIRACAGLITSGLLLRMVAIISIDEFRALFKGDAEFAVIDSVQQGLGSRSYQPGPLMIDRENSRYSEHAVAAIQQLWRDAMGYAYE
jgi:hypothetical protein